MQDFQALVKSDVLAVYKEYCSPLAGKRAASRGSVEPEGGLRGEAGVSDFGPAVGPDLSEQ